MSSVRANDLSILSEVFLLFSGVSAPCFLQTARRSSVYCRSLGKISLGAAVVRQAMPEQAQEVKAREAARRAPALTSCVAQASSAVDDGAEGNFPW